MDTYQPFFIKVKAISIKIDYGRIGKGGENLGG